MTIHISGAAEHNLKDVDVTISGGLTVVTGVSGSGKTSLVTGASGYLGGAMARALAEAGSRVAVTSRDADRARAVAGALPDPHGLAHRGWVLDQMDAQSIERGFADLVRRSR